MGQSWDMTQAGLEPESQEECKAKCGVLHISDMRIVILGGRVQGKSSSGNTILGRQEFGTAGRTAECVKREGETAGRHVTVVEAPGWWINYTVEQTPERDKGEIVRSVSLCPPGPHALLLVIRVSQTFTETYRRAVQEHVELLGERVWSHTIVLFTYGDYLGDTSIEQHIESGGEALQWVVEKCGNRYHVVDNKKTDGGQVTELLEKIEEMVSGNKGHHVDFDAKIINGLMKRKKEEKRRGKKRRMEVKKQRKTLRSSAGGVPHISDMRIVLLGNRNAGKSSSGNTILGRREFGNARRTAECVKGRGETAGRHITVVEAPGWGPNSPVEETPERDKGEIVLSVSLCPPGPHALILVIRVSHSFTDTCRRAVQEHMELLGERVWSHTILLFTRGDWLRDTSIEQHIESGGKALQWVVEKCGNRYHVVDNKKTDGGQVTDLLQKIEEMVVGNKGHHVDFDAEIITGLVKRKKEEKKRGEERKMKVKKQRETLRSSAGGVPHISDMRIVLLGNRDAGKSSSGNKILGRQVFGSAGRTAVCVKREGETAGRHITVVEAPGWRKNSTVVETPERDKGEIVSSVSLCPPGPHALLLVIRAAASFTETHRRAVQEHMELLGEKVWSHTILLFTIGDWLGDTSIEQHIESEGEPLQWVVEKCGNRYHVVDNEKRDGGQVTELLEKIEEMVAGSSGEWSMGVPPEFGDGHTQVSTSGDSALGSSKSSGVSKLMRRLKTLSTAPSTTSSGYGTGQSEMSGSAGSSSLMAPRSRLEGETKTTTAHRSAGSQRQGLFVDISTISLNETECIGRGSFGSVYKGSYQGKTAAVKVIQRHVGGTQVTTNELMIPRRLCHPNIVQMMACSVTETRILIANEYIDGPNLHNILHCVTPVKLQQQDKLSVALDISMAVEYIHDRGVIHQDLKPANIVVSSCSKRAYLTDWGLANVRDSVIMTTRATGHMGAGGGMLGGTPPYMARECLALCRKCSTRSDMWSLGITLLEMFTNSKPWLKTSPQEIRERLFDQKSPDALAKLQPPFLDIVKPLLLHEPESRMSATDVVLLLKKKVKRST
ncbi:GTPase IMAP family member 8-like [Engraulis encrasicolus]|uniref:GTPase IMAP family member 8-like n=1 Tax=Engraulis encrasicolus TaxID=184585 RepID=UPI002FD70F62